MKVKDFISFLTSELPTSKGNYKVQQTYLDKWFGDTVITRKKKIKSNAHDCNSKEGKLSMSTRQDC